MYSKLLRVSNRCVSYGSIGVPTSRLPSTETPKLSQKPIAVSLPQLDKGKIVHHYRQRMPGRSQRFKGRFSSEPMGNETAEINHGRRPFVAEPSVEELENVEHPALLRKQAAEDAIQESVRRDTYVRNRRIAEKKYGFRAPSEDNMLTWDSKEIIRKLIAEDPELWTSERISECFPVSVLGASRLCRCLRRYFDKSDSATVSKHIEAHDAEVRKRWDALINNTSGVLSDYTLFLFKTGKMKFIPYNAQSPPRIVNAVAQPQRVTGEYSRLIARHIRLLNKGSYNTGAPPRIASSSAICSYDSKR